MITPKNKAQDNINSQVGGPGPLSKRSCFISQSSESSTKIGIIIIIKIPVAPEAPLNAIGSAPRVACRKGLYHIFKILSTAWLVGVSYCITYILYIPYYIPLGIQFGIPFGRPLGPGFVLGGAFCLGL